MRKTLALVFVSAVLAACGGQQKKVEARSVPASRVESSSERAPASTPDVVVPAADPEPRVRGCGG